jgi:NADPH2:quinone reductase
MKAAVLHEVGGIPRYGLRTSGVEIYGAARGLDATVMAEVYGQVVRWAQDGTLTFDVAPVPLSDIEAAWRRPAPRGRRLVVVA